MTIPLTRSCPECQGEMELLTSDDVGEVLVYECPDCGNQIESRVESLEEQGDGHHDSGESVPGTDTEDNVDVGEEERAWEPIEPDDNP